ncbi:MAG: flagellar motor switch protein FliG [Treponema sp.]|jgi:flagellar motor switch protein FliG|nr:flagellar motor switch protein FliG [Treponema sp.]
MGNIQRRGIAAYQKTMKLPPDAEDAAPKESVRAEQKHKEAEKDQPRDFIRPSVPAAANRPGDPGGLLKTLQSLPQKETLRVPRPGSVLPGPGGGEDSKCRRVAKLLILIGSDQAAQILAELDPGQVEEISREIASIRGISAEEGGQILSEFRSLFSTSYGFSPSSSGGIETARRILYSAYGPEKGEALLNKSVPGSKGNIFDFLEEFVPEQIVFLLKDETPQTAALVLARLPPKISAETLGKFPSALKPEILKRIAHQSEIAPDVLEQVSTAIREKARHLGSGGAKDIEIDGMQTLAAILKQGDYSFGDRLINELETESPGIGKDLKDKLYTLDDVLKAADRPIAEKLKTMANRDIAILLKGRGNEFREKILSCVSAGRRGLVREEGEILGPVSRRDCDAAARDFLAWFRNARDKGEIILSDDEDVVI